MQKYSISIIGLGKLGSPMVATYASKGHDVIGLDINNDFVKAINKKEPLIFEPHLKEFLNINKGNISATCDYREAVLNSDITFIVVPTPSKKEGGFLTDYAVRAAEKIAEVIKEKSDFHLVVLTSTVTPGSNEKDIIPALESKSGKKCGKDFGFCYNPEFIALGSVIYNILNPDFVLIGESDERSGEILYDFYSNICENSPSIKRMSIVNAEIVKIALNTYVTTKISYANMLAELCEKIPGGDVDVVTDALGCDTRIGPKYLKGGLGYGGPCFPRDNRALVYTALKHNVVLPIAEATDIINNNQKIRIADLILSFLPLGKKVGFLGLSYKPQTDVVEESHSIEIVKILLKKGVEVAVFDPAAMDNAKKVLDGKIVFASSAQEAISTAELIVIATPWPDFKNISFDSLDGKIVIDAWRMLDYKKYKGIKKYIPIGINEF